LPLQAVERVRAESARGLDGDRHARPNSRRSILMMEQEVLEEFGLPAGAVREQVTIRGFDLYGLAAGRRLRIGTALLELGAACAPCERMNELRAGLQQALEGRRGRFVRVVEAGTFAVGDPIEVEPPSA
jgi:MOSC domain-containing protein YiiM